MILVNHSQRTIHVGYHVCVLGTVASQPLTSLPT